MNTTSTKSKFCLRNAIRSARFVTLCHVVIGSRDEPIGLSATHALKILENYTELEWEDYEKNDAIGGFWKRSYEFNCPTTGKNIGEFIEYEDGESVFKIYASIN